MVARSRFRTTEGISKLAQPLASDKLLKKSLKLVKKSCKYKIVKRGVKEVQKTLRKQMSQTKKKGSSVKGLCFIAGDISPVDIISHLPCLCEDKEIPYVFIPSKKMLGEACKSKRPTSCLLVINPTDADLKKVKDIEKVEEEDIQLFHDVVKKVNKVAPIY